MLCGRATLLVSRFGPSASVIDVSDTCSGGLNYIQVRGRRRTMVKPPWMHDKYVKIRDALPKEDREYLERELQLEIPQRKLVISRTDLSTDMNHQAEVQESPVSYSFDYSKRIGLVGRKIGMAPQWLSDGYRTPCTLIHVYDNHVLQVTDPSTWYKRSLIGKRKAFGPFGPVWNVLVGAFDKESIFYTDRQRRIFEKAKVPCKEQIVSFVTSEDAIVKPGTKLDVRHFQIGQYVSVSGKTIDWGFQGVMHRWGFKGGNANATKAHRRPGSIGVKGEAKVWPGRRLPGHMGYEWRHMHGLEVLRINPIKQILYIRGSVPGDVGETVLIKDCMMLTKRPQDPPFPTFYPPSEELEEEENGMLERMRNEIQLMTSRDIYSTKMFRFNQPTIEYTEANQTAMATIEGRGAKIAKAGKGKK